MFDYNKHWLIRYTTISASYTAGNLISYVEEMRHYPLKKDVIRRQIQTALTREELRRLKVMAAEMDSHTVTLATLFIRLGMDSEREFIKQELEGYRKRKA